MPRPSGGSVTNRLLAALPGENFRALASDFEVVELSLKQVLHEPGEPTRWVHFPNAGVISMLTVLSNGWSIELATVGNEGMVDISVVLGTARSESRNIVQVPGRALRMQSGRFREHLESQPHLRELLGAYTFEVFTMTAQNSACQRAHSARARIARWLLTTHDRVDADEFAMTHEFLVEMTGVTRPSVTGTLSALADGGAISTRRGHVAVKDREALEAEACECYWLIRERFQRLAGGEGETGGRRTLSSGLEASE